VFAAGSNRSKRREASITLVDRVRVRLEDDILDLGWSQESRRAEQVVVFPRPARPATIILSEMTRGRSWRDPGGGRIDDDEGDDFLAAAATSGMFSGIVLTVSLVLVSLLVFSFSLCLCCEGMRAL